MWNGTERTRDWATQAARHETFLRAKSIVGESRETGRTNYSLGLKQKQQTSEMKTNGEHLGQSLIGYGPDWLFFREKAVCTPGVRKSKSSDKAFLSRGRETHTLWSVRHRELAGEGAGVRVSCAAQPASPSWLFVFRFAREVTAEQRALLHPASKGAKRQSTPRSSKGQLSAASNIHGDVSGSKVRNG